MFEQAFVDTTAKTSRTGPVAASLVLQITLLLCGIVAPLVNPDVLPRAILAVTLVTAPPLPPPPAPPHPSPATITKAVVSKLLKDTPFIAPSRIPKTTAVIDDTELLSKVGVPGSITSPLSGSSRDSVINSLVSQAHYATPPPPPPAQAADTPKKPIDRITVGGNIQEARILSRQLPQYPRIALQAGVSGNVVFHAVIGRDGAIQALQLLSGHPLLVRAATDAVRQWRYRPLLLNGDPMEVDTTIEVRFTLNDR